MSKGTAIKDAIKRWEEKHPGQNPAQATEVGLQFQWPPIDKMDASLGSLTNVQKLSLSTNMIEKIAGLAGLKFLKILSLSRNYIKSFAGLVKYYNQHIQEGCKLKKQFEPVADTLEELWMSYNIVEKLKGIGFLKKLKVLYIGNNMVKEWAQFNGLQELPALEDLLFGGNPLSDNLDEAVYKAEASKRLPNLKKLEGETVLREEADED